MPENPIEISDAVIASLLAEIGDGADPYLTAPLAHVLLTAKGIPLTDAQVRNLIVETWVLGGRNVAPWSRWLTGAKLYIGPRVDQPNRKIAAVAVARKAKAQKTTAAR